jgi:2-amino-4-hydroxy-6-hydroxymethyldihydropteridine diphosphokinase
VAAPGRVRAYVGLGSNLGDPLAQVLSACEALARLPRSRWLGRSSLYRSRPLGDADQPDYVNAVAAIDTALGAEDLLGALQDIEAAHGRARGGERWASRTLDLDLLLYGRERIRTGRLTVPHPGIAGREFVLHPLCELDPDVVVPGLGPLRERAGECALRGLRRIEEPG